VCTPLRLYFTAFVNVMSIIECDIQNSVIDRVCRSEFSCLSVLLFL
jgi:hypothetical protein